MVVPCMAAEPEQLTVEEGRRGQIKKKKRSGAAEDQVQRSPLEKAVTREEIRQR